MKKIFVTMAMLAAMSSSVSAAQWSNIDTNNCLSYGINISDSLKNEQAIQGKNECTTVSNITANKDCEKYTFSYVCTTVFPNFECTTQSKPNFWVTTEATTQSKPNTEVTTEATTQSKPNFWVTTEATTQGKPSTEATTEVTTQGKPNTEVTTEATTQGKPSTEATTEATTQGKPTTEVTTEATTNGSQNNNSTYAEQVLSLVNKHRADNGLSPLSLNSALSNTAYKKAEDMRANGYFSHTSPNYGSPFDMIKADGISYRTAGENIAKGQKTPEAVVNAWMNSEGHRANILNSGYSSMGLGYSGGYWCQLFIG